MTRLDRLRTCGVYRAPTAAAVTVKVDGAGVAGFGGVSVCGLVWACPCCSAAIRTRRSVELEDLVLRHVNQGGGAGFGTLTMPHGRGDRLKPLLRCLSASWQAVRQSRGVRAAMEAAGVVGFVRAVEITHGDNGWHPHLHVLALTEQPLTAEQWLVLEAAISQAWRKAVVRQGFREPSADHGVRWQPVQGVGAGSALAKYLTKVQDDGGDRSIGQEMTRGDLKQGRKKSVSVFEILDGAARGEDRWLRLWWEYEQATRGHRVLTWSAGLRKRLGALPDERTDEELAAADAAGVVVAELSDEEWRDVVKFGAEARVLDAAERAGAEGVAEVLRTLAKRRRFDAQRR